MSSIVGSMVRSTRILVLLFLPQLVPTPCWASATFNGRDFSLDANNYIELHREEGWLEAQGSVHFQGKGLDLRADRIALRLDMEKLETKPAHELGASELLTRLELIGTVSIDVEMLKIQAERVTYDPTTSRLSMLGDLVLVDSPTLRLEAQEQADYWLDSGEMVFRKGAEFRGQGYGFKGLRWLIAMNPKTRTIDRIQVEGQVDFRQEVDAKRIQAESAVYDVTSDFVSFCGSVRIEDAGAVLSGECAELNLETGRSRITGTLGLLELRGGSTAR